MGIPGCEAESRGRISRKKSRNKKKRRRRKEDMGSPLPLTHVYTMMDGGLSRMRMKSACPSHSSL
jgi:hypothetical protein